MTGFPFRPAKAVAQLKAADPALAAIIEAVGPFGMELKASRSLFGALAEAIVYQQLSNKAAATIYRRVEALYPRATAGFTPRHILATPDEKWRPYRTVASWYLWRALDLPKRQPKRHRRSRVRVTDVLRHYSVFRMQAAPL